MKTEQTHFYNTIFQLRTSEDLILYDKVVDISSYEDELVIEFLKNEYEEESLNHPFTPPIFDEKAALWASKIFYLFSQWIVYRIQEIDELERLILPFEFPKTVSAVLSADLCLRFLPLIKMETNYIDPEDPILIHMNSIMKDWSYSSIGYLDETENLDITELDTNLCLKQLFVDRVMERKDKKMAKLPPIYSHIKASMGDYQHIFWKEFNLIENE